MAPYNFLAPRNIGNIFMDITARGFGKLHTNRVVSIQV